MREGKYTMVTKSMLGFKRDIDDNIIIDEEEAKIVRLIFKLYLEGHGIGKICRILEDKGYKTVTGKTNWSNASISNILDNEKYKGDATMQKFFNPDFKSNRSKENTGELPMYKVFDTHPAIIDDETFEKVQKMRHVRALKYTTRTKGEPNRPEYTSFLTCHYCGKNYHYKKIKTDNIYSKEHFICSSNTSRINCEGLVLSNHVFEQALLELINMIIKNKRNFSKDIEEIMLANVKHINVKKRYDKLNKEIAVLERRIKGLKDESNSLNKALKGEFKAKLKGLLVERSKYYKMLATSYNVEAFIKRKRALFEKFNQPIGNVNDFPFRDLFSQVTVLSPSVVIFHLGFIDNEIKKESYLQGTIPYKFRRSNKTFDYYLVV